MKTGRPDGPGPYYRLYRYGVYRTIYYYIYIKLDTNTPVIAGVTLTFEEQIVLNLEAKVVAIVNLCMVRKNSEMTNFEVKRMYM